MSKQYDFNPGLDLSSLSSANLSQIVQAIAQIVPLSNIGGVICQAGNSTLQSGHPDVVQNPRFIRYLWIDIENITNPIFKRYKSYRNLTPESPNYDSTYEAWVAAATDDDAILANMVKAGAVTLFDNAADPKIANLFSNAASAGEANYILRLDSNGQWVEIVSLYDVLAPNKVTLDSLSLSSAAITGAGAYKNYILKINSAGTHIGFELFDVNSIADLSLTNGKIAANQITYDKIKPSSESGGGISIHRLSPITETPNGSKMQTLRVNTGATAFEYWTPPILQIKSATFSSAASGTGTFPADNTIPQISEGNSVTGDALDITITPLLGSGLSVFRITGIMHLGLKAVIDPAAFNYYAIVAIFKEGTNDALGVFQTTPHVYVDTSVYRVNHIMSIPIDLEIANLGVAVTIKPRYGPLSGVIDTCYLNPDAAAAFGLAIGYVSRLEVAEIVKTV